MNADRGLTIFCLILGAYWAFTGLFTYGLWVNNGPGPGFLPTIIGALTCIFAGMQLIKQLKEEAEPFDKRALLPMAAMVGFALCAYVIGFFVSIFFFLIAWPVIRGGYSMKFSVIFSVAVTSALWGIFAYWLQVPFPSSLIGL